MLWFKGFIPAARTSPQAYFGYNISLEEKKRLRRQEKWWMRE
jgi:hypothetical protein